MLPVAPSSRAQVGSAIRRQNHVAIQTLGLTAGSGRAAVAASLSRRGRTRATLPRGCRGSSRTCGQAPADRVAGCRRPIGRSRSYRVLLEEGIHLLNGPSGISQCSLVPLGSLTPNGLAGHPLLLAPDPRL